MGKRAAVAKPCLCLCRRLPQILPESIRQIIRLLTQRKTTWLHRSRLGLFALFPGEHFFRLNEAFSKFNWFLLCVILKVKFLMYSKSWKILYYIWTWICTTFVRKLAATKQIKQFHQTHITSVHTSPCLSWIRFIPPRWRWHWCQGSECHEWCPG